MTDKPTDEALENLFVEETGFDPDDFPAAIFGFARAVLAKWGQPAQAAEPVARLEIESLKAQLHAAKQINAAQFRLLAASIPGSALRASHGQAPAKTGNSVSAQADSVQEDAAREVIKKVLALFPFNALIQKFSVNNGPFLTADNDDEFYSVKRVLAFLTEIKTTLDAARKQGGV